MAIREIFTSEDFPTKPHWAILRFDTYYSDDGWSEAEGGGVCPHPFVRYFVCDTEAEWRAELEHLFKQNPARKDLSAISAVKPAILTPVLGINIG